jgi:hypothetical protein
MQTQLPSPSLFVQFLPLPSPLLNYLENIEFYAWLTLEKVYCSGGKSLSEASDRLLCWRPPTDFSRQSNRKLVILYKFAVFYCSIALSEQI